MPSSADAMLALALVVLCASGVTSQEFSCINSNISTVNPLGTCRCEGNLWIGNKCTEGYFCQDIDGNGCHIICPPGLFLLVSFQYGYWQCSNQTINLPPLSTTTTTTTTTLAPPPAPMLFGHVYDADEIEPHMGVVCGPTFDICPSGSATPASTPPTIPTTNPLGQCGCVNDTWVSEGCSYAFVCAGDGVNGGTYFDCRDSPDPLKSVVFNIGLQKLECGESSRCFGGEFNTGCRDPNCQYIKNPLGECDGCNGQLFINQDCSQGFVCYSDVDPFLQDGCYKECQEGEILVPNVASRDWSCQPRDATDFVCPGQFKLNCPSEDVGSDFTSEDCTTGCDNELIVSSDCKEAFYCLSRFVGGGRSIKCEDPNQIVEVSLKDFEWECTDNTQTCPGLGGYKVGCNGGGLPNPPPFLNCNGTAPADFAPCQCNNQFFINDDCSESFYCTNRISDSSPGCHLICGEGEVVRLDIVNQNWDCVPRTSTFVCPANFVKHCAPADGPGIPVACECANQFWMSNNCNQGFMCSGPQGSNGVNPGTAVSCPPGTVIDIDFNSAFNYTCSQHVQKCPGAFHMGCASNPVTTTTTTVSTTTGTGSTTTTTIGTGSTTTTTTGTGSTTTTTTTTAGTGSSSSTTSPTTTTPNGAAASTGVAIGIVLVSAIAIAAVL